MNENRIIVFTFADCMGGVSSFNRNIINFAGKRPGFSVRVILMNDEQDTRSKFRDEIIADEVIEFRYSYWNNQRQMFKKLSALIGEEKGCVVTDNAYTLNVLKQLGTPKSIVQLVHDYYYINVARDYKLTIDAWAVHSSFFRDVLYAMDVERFGDKVEYIRYGVEQAGEDFVEHEAGSPLHLLFLGRWAESKGVLLLREVDRLLRERSIAVRWTIVGSGPLEKELKQQWVDDKEVRFITAADTQEVYKILATQDILVFPSKFEGTPVAIMEAMSRGVIPVVSDLPGGTREMVTTATGFLCKSDRAGDFADAIEKLYRDPALLKAMKRSCLKASGELYDIKKAAGRYFDFFEKTALVPSEHNRQKKLTFNRLDNPLLPDKLVYWIRKRKTRN